MPYFGIQFMMISGRTIGRGIAAAGRGMTCQPYARRAQIFRIYQYRRTNLDRIGARERSTDLIESELVLLRPENRKPSANLNNTGDRRDARFVNHEQQVVAGGRQERARRRPNREDAGGRCGERQLDKPLLEVNAVGH